MVNSFPLYLEGVNYSDKCVSLFTYSKNNFFHHVYGFRLHEQLTETNAVDFYSHYPYTLEGSSSNVETLMMSTFQFFLLAVTTLLITALAVSRVIGMTSAPLLGIPNSATFVCFFGI